MRKIGKLYFVFIGILILLAGTPLLQAQDVEVSASLTETNIFAGEQVKLNLTVSGSSIGAVDEPALPDIPGLRWLRGSTSRGTRYALLNGKPSVTYTFGYLLIAQNPGSYQVPPINVQVENETFSTAPIDFKILDPATIDNGEAERAPDIYLKLEPSTERPYVGQQVVTNVILYFKNGIEVSSYQPTPGWKAEGFWKEELEYPQRAQTSSTVINGVRYQRARLLQYALFPTKSGELTLSPFEITVTVRKQRRTNDIFGFNLNQERVNLQSTPTVLDVQPLPELEDAQFIGAVGQFEVKREISAQEAYVGESIEIVTTVKGSGNVPLINKPEYRLPESLEKYNPEDQTTIDRTDQNISGIHTFTDIVIARSPGTYTLPATRLAAFDPNKKRYVIFSMPKLTFKAERDPNAASVSQEQLKLNVLPITGLANWVEAGSIPLYKRSWVWILLLLPILLTGALYGYKKFDDRMNTDTAFARSRTAHDTASKNLKLAEQTQDVKEGYHLIEKTLVQFITDKMNLPPAGISHDNLIEEVRAIADHDVTSELKRLLTKCETIAYAPNATQESLNTDIEKTRTLVKKLGKLT